MSNNIVLSICCITYNHKDYIENALKSFLNQKVRFDYEIIVHDDASTDGTTQLLIKYQKKYPNIVKPIYQTVNQYSKGTNIFINHILPNIKGKYVAFCEGDDFWCDKLKLEKQVDFLDQHPDYSACVHNTSIWDQETGKKDKKINEIDYGDKDITVERILQWDSSVPFHTSSIVCRKEIFENGLPKFYILPKCFGDYPLALYMASKKKIHFIDDIMSVYRAFVPNSYSNRTKDINYHTKKEMEKISMLEEFGRYTEHQYDDLIKENILNIEFRLNIEKKDFKKNLLSRYKNIRQKMNISQRLKLYIKAYCIHIYYLYNGLKKIKERCFIF